MEVIINEYKNETTFGDLDDSTHFTTSEDPKELYQKERIDGTDYAIRLSGGVWASIPNDTVVTPVKIKRIEVDVI